MATNLYSNTTTSKAPHELPPDGSMNPAYRDGVPRVQFPIGELAARGTSPSASPTTGVTTKAGT